MAVKEEKVKVLFLKQWYDKPLDDGKTVVARVIDEITEMPISKAKELEKKKIVKILG